MSLYTYESCLYTHLRCCPAINHIVRVVYHSLYGTSTIARVVRHGTSLAHAVHVTTLYIVRVVYHSLYVTSTIARVVRHGTLSSLTDLWGV